MENTATTTAETPKPASKIRWWPGALIVGLAGGVLGYIWIFEDVQRQNKNIQTLIVTVATLGLLLLWVLLLSRLRWKRRFQIVGGVLAALGLFAACFQITGVSGDLVPELAWRWKSKRTLKDFNDEFAASPDVGGEIEGVPAFSQFGGSNRDGVLPGIKLSRDWDASPPKELWRRPVGGGWSGFATFGSRAVTMEQRGNQEWITCYHVVTGDPQWSYAYDAEYISKVAGDGPRTVPTIDSGFVYCIGSTGVLTCLTLETGELKWSKNILDEHDRSPPEWGFSSSPLVLGDRVITNPGGHDDASIVAYDRSTGEKLWGGGIDSAHYSSPVLTSLHGVPQVLLFNRKRIVGHDPENGDVLWEYDWFGPNQPNVTMPVVVEGNRVLASAGYGEGTDLFRVDRADGEWSTERVWRSKRLKSKFGWILVIDGFVYGLDDGVFTCIDLETGERSWKKGRYGHGQMILAGDVILMMAEQGDVVMIDPKPDALHELARVTAFDSKTWNPLALAGEYLLVRNDREAVCYQLPVLEK